MAGGDVDLDAISDIEFEYDDWNDVCEALGRCSGRWRDIARGVGLAPDQLEEIEENDRRASDRLSKVIQTWIGQNYNTQKFGLPSWRTLCKALKRVDPKLCKDLARAHPGPNPDGYEYVRGSLRDESAPPSFEGQRLSAIPQWGELSLLKYMKDGKKQKLNIISRASPKWRDIATNISTRPEIIAQASQKYRDDSVECLRHVLNECFIKNQPKQYDRNWSGIIEMLEDVDEETLAMEVKDAVLRK